uniref:Uncharacterized protein n=1 Tax=Bionectria ochroleuca TaxID=29856 RepID=A0A8H7TRI8_BIOOC
MPSAAISSLPPDGTLRHSCVANGWEPNSKKMTNICCVKPADARRQIANLFCMLSWLLHLADLFHSTGASTQPGRQQCHPKEVGSETVNSPRRSSSSGCTLPISACMSVIPRVVRKLHPSQPRGDDSHPHARSRAASLPPGSLIGEG